MNRRAFVVPVLALLLLTATTYLPALRCGFIWDDDYYVTKNQALHSLDGLKKIWFELGTTPQYYPLTFTSFWGEYHLWKLQPLGYHLVNVLLHALNAVLLWRVLKRLEIPGAWWAAAIFAVHPVTVESVAWVTERKNVLSGLFYLGSVLAYLRFRNGRKWHWRFYGLSLALFVCALLSKTVTCSLPAVLALLIWWKAGRLEKRDILSLVPLFALGAALGLTTVWMEKHQVGASGLEWTLSFVQRCLLAGRALWFYAVKVIWPHNLAFIYPRWEIDPRAAWQYAFPLAALVVLIALCRLRSRIGRGPLVAVMFFAGTLLPALGFFDVFPFRYAFVADHFQYLACIGLIALGVSAGAVVAQKAGRVGQNLGVLVAATVLLLLAVASWRQTHAYQDQETLWTDTLAKNPRAFIAHNNLGLILHNRKQPEQAVEHFREALLIKPDYVEARSNLGLVLTALGHYEEAEQQLQGAVRIRPDFSRPHICLGQLYYRLNRLEDAKHQYALAIQSRPSLASAHYELGCIWQQQGQRNRAIVCYKNALLISPDYVEAHNNLANLLAEDGNLQAAIEHFQLALKTDPNSGRIHCALGLKLVELNRTDEAIDHFRQAIRVTPAYTDGYIQLARTLTKNSRFAEAIAALKEGSKSNPNDPVIANNHARLLITCPVAELRNATEAIQIAEGLVKANDRKRPDQLDTLAAAYAEAGRFEEAGAAAREALTAAQSTGNTNLAAQISSHLALYEKHQPLRMAQP